MIENDCQRLLRISKELDRREARRLFFSYFPDTGELRRDLYPKHILFMRMGAIRKTRCFMAGNRIGKTVTGAFEVTCHLTGRYPEWWTGHRFTGPISVWCAGDTSKTVRDIIQLTLLGKVGEYGTGMIPGDDLVRTTPKQGIPDAVESIFVRHISGMISVCTLKSYDQGRKAFQGTAQDVIWLDEESDEMIRGECVMRLMTTQGLLIETFTPLEGITPIVKMYLPGGEMKASVSGAILSSQKALVMAGWDDVPHLSEEDKARMAAETLPYQLEARRTGTPSLGSGAIYPVPEAQITVDDFAIPDHWLRAYGMDVGWDFTAALWGALDRESDILYLYSVYKGGKSEPPIHATAIKARGEWIPGKADSAATNQDDGEKMLTLYQNEGLLITLPDKSVEVGLYDVWTRLSTGRLKVFKSLAPFFEEYRVYRRDERGRIVKENDHIMDCARYLVRSGLSVAIAKPCIIYDPNAIIRNPRQSTSAMTA